MNRCQNCEWTGTDERLARKLEDVPDLFERVAPGEPMPSGECPQCGALCQPIEMKTYRITETITFEIAAPTAQAAVSDWLNKGEQANGYAFCECTDREVADQDGRLTEEEWSDQER